MKRRKLALTLLMASGPLAAAYGQAPSAAGYVYRPPAPADDGWEVGELAAAGMDASIMKALVDEIRAQRLPNLHAVVVVKGGKLVFEEYFEGPDERRGEPAVSVRFDRGMVHDLRSVTKSVTSALVGAAVAQGAMKSPATGVFSFFPEHANLGTDGKERITVHHLLTMTSGLEWDEDAFPYSDPRNSETAMDSSPSSIRFVLERRLLEPPGSRFNYCGGCTMLLAGIVRRATGRDLDAFAKEALFRPLGIADYHWYRHADGLPIAASGLRLRPRDMAKIGLLYLTGGRWRGQQVLPESWIAESTRRQVALDGASGYGYHWWIDEGPGDPRVFVARGNGGQRIYVAPAADLVVVITAGNYNDREKTRGSERAFWRFILQASLRGGGVAP